MTEHENREETELSQEDFEKALAESPSHEFFRVGDKVSGTIVAIGKEQVFLDIGTRSEGILQSAELLDEEGNLTVAVGVELEVTVVSLSAGIHVSYKMRKRDQSKELLFDAFENKIPVQGTVAETNKGGFVINLGIASAFCPISQIDLEYVEDPKPYVGQSFHFLITRFDASGKNNVVSRSALLREEVEKKRAETLSLLKPDMIIDGEVRRITEFGAFVDLGGIDGLIHISELSWDRVEHPSEILTVGEKVKVKILKIDEQNKRIGLSLRDIEGDPWDTKVGTEIQEHQIYTGKITRVESYGAFVRLVAGIEGLLHVSEMAWGRRINHPREVVSAGAEVKVQVLGIDREKRRISLGMKQLTEDPWTKIIGSLAIGAEVEVEVLAVKPAGIEVALNEGVIGFIPASLSGVARGENLSTIFKIRSKVKAKIAEIRDENRSIIFKVGGNADNQEEKQAVRAYKNTQNLQHVEEKQRGVGSFGELLMNALDKNKKK